jgi:hypothetical protein
MPIGRLHPTWNLVPFGVHALLVCIVVTPLDLAAGAIRLGRAKGRVSQKTGPGPDGGPGPSEESIAACIRIAIASARSFHQRLRLLRRNGSVRDRFIYQIFHELTPLDELIHPRQQPVSLIGGEVIAVNQLAQ